VRIGIQHLHQAQHIVSHPLYLQKLVHRQRPKHMSLKAMRFMRMSQMLVLVMRH
jgi:hypothetical protein